MGAGFLAMFTFTENTNKKRRVRCKSNIFRNTKTSLSKISYESLFLFYILIIIQDYIYLLLLYTGRLSLQEGLDYTTINTIGKTGTINIPNKKYKKYNTHNNCIKMEL